VVCGLQALRAGDLGSNVLPYKVVYCRAVNKSLIWIESLD
jgi:hypothetical protein